MTHVTYITGHSVPSPNPASFTAAEKLLKRWHRDGSPRSSGDEQLHP